MEHIAEIRRRLVALESVLTPPPAVGGSGTASAGGTSLTPIAFIEGQKYMLPKGFKDYFGKEFTPENKLGSFITKKDKVDAYTDVPYTEYTFTGGKFDTTNHKKILHAIIPDLSAEGGRRKQRKTQRQKRQRKTY